MFSISAIIAALTVAWTVSADWVQLDKNILPVIDFPLPILSLGRPAFIPDETLNVFINASAPNITLVTNGDGDKEAYDGERLVALVNVTTGETNVFPDLGNLQPAQQNINTTLARTFLSLNQSFPRDDTNFTVVPGADLAGSRFFNNSQAEAPQIYLTHTLVQRNVTVQQNLNFSVCGPGSRASFGFGADGLVRSLSYQWKPAFISGQVKSNKTDDVYKNIITVLEPLAQSSNGTLLVDFVDVCLYDSGENFIQPVFHFTGILRAGVNVTATQTRIEGYLPFGVGSPEGLPDLNAKSPLGDPSFSGNTTSPPSLTLSARGVKPSIRVGRYVVRDDVQAWVNNANSFWDNLHTSSSAAFINDQYYWAEPRLFTNEKNFWVNHVHIADIEVHGNYHLFTTEKNCCDRVILDDIPKTGYGGSGGGALAYWILHSCDIIPTVVDYPTGSRVPWDVWWNIFNGMRAAVSYRTQMYIADHVMGRFGKAIAKGSPFVMSWLQTVHDDGIYKRNGKDIMYFDDNQNKNQPMGRASAVVVCGHENDLAWQVDNLGAPSCLRMYWYNN